MKYLILSFLLIFNAMANQRIIDAIIDGKFSAVKYYLDNDQSADINFKDYNGRSALHHAAINLNDEALIELLKYKPSIDDQDNYGATALFYSTSRINQRMSRVLIRAGANLNLLTNDNQSALFNAINMESMGAARDLIKAGANPNTAHIETLDTPLILSTALSNNPEILEGLIALGANLELKNARGYTALQEAALWNKNNALETLIAAGANINALNKSGEHSIHKAAAYKFPSQCLSILINAGINVNLKTHNDLKNTPLIISARKGNYYQSKLLINHGADVHYKNGLGQSALDAAKLSGNTVLIDFLKSLSVK